MASWYIKIQSLRQEIEKQIVNGLYGAKGFVLQYWELCSHRVHDIFEFYAHNIIRLTYFQNRLLNTTFIR
jgi:hypothetical protein